MSQPIHASERETVLVTGACGFIGRALTKLLRREGYAVILLDRAPVGDPCAEPSRIQVSGDISNPKDLQGVFEKHRITRIVHLAAILPTAAQREPELATRVNVLGSLNLLEMARQRGVRRIVFGSSLSVYGSYPADRAVSEADRAAPADLYGATKICVEQLGSAYRENHGLDFVSLRIGRVVGAGAESATSAWRSQIFEFLPRMERSEIEIPYSQSERVLLVHVNDAATMLVKLLLAQRLEHFLYNACCESVVVGELKKRVEELNPNIYVELGDVPILGNPRLLDCTRFEREFAFEAPPIFEQLRVAATSASAG